MSKRRRATDYHSSVLGFVLRAWANGLTHRRILTALSQAGVRMSRMDLRKLLDAHCRTLEPYTATPVDIARANEALYYTTHGRYGARASGR